MSVRQNDKTALTWKEHRPLTLYSSGQLVAEYPFIYLMSRLHLTKFVGVTVFVHPCKDMKNLGQPMLTQPVLEVSYGA